MRFSAKDKDQDTKKYESCAQKHTGAFWHADCHHVNINGQYLKGQNDQGGKGATWMAFKGQSYSLKTTQMKFRPDYIKHDVNQNV